MRLKNIIKEQIKQLNEAKETPACIKKFGDYLFGEYSEWYKKNMETNTIPEEDVWNRFTQFIFGMGMNKGKDPKLVKGLKELQKCVDSYPEILKPKKNELYRGSKLPISQLKSDYIDKWSDAKLKSVIYWIVDRGYLQGLHPAGAGDDINKFIPMAYWSNDNAYLTVDRGKFKYSPSSQFQSWSEKESVARQFSSKAQNNKEGNVGCVLKAKFKPSELLFNSKFIDRISGLSEAEVLRIGGPITNCELTVPIFAIRHIIVNDKKLKKIWDKILTDWEGTPIPYEE